MEVTHDGELVRQYHPGPNYRIMQVNNSRYRIQRQRLRISEVRVLLCPSQFVSKFHCEITRRDRAYWIRDLGSTNGTYLNGYMITEMVDRELRFGDIIGLGISHAGHGNLTDVTEGQFYIFQFTQAAPLHGDSFDNSSGLGESFVAED